MLVCLLHFFEVTRAELNEWDILSLSMKPEIRRGPGENIRGMLEGVGEIMEGAMVSVGFSGGGTEDLEVFNVVGDGAFDISAT